MSAPQNERPVVKYFKKREENVAVEAGLGTCCADRMITWAGEENPIAIGDFYGFLPAAGNADEQ